MSKEFYNHYWEHNAPPETDPLTPRRLELFSIEAKNRNIHTVLDVGCGRGVITHTLSLNGLTAQGIDISETAIHRARKSFPDLTFQTILSDGLFPVESESIDALFCAEVIEHIYDTEGFVREMARVLKPGGFCFVTTPYHGWIKNLLLTVLGFDKHFDVTGPHIRFFSDRSLSNLLQSARIKVHHTHHIGRFFPLWMDTIICGTKSP
ncbi:MAG: class I SAM-dependent methyltransferase [bacterium]|nr:class I SAM-dependent methyltransferase [bacterium]